jgi:hypothetical protein
MSLDEYLRLLSPEERTWIDRLERYAEDTGKSLPVVLVEALVERHRAALDLEDGFTHARQTIIRQAQALREHERA